MGCGSAGAVEQKWFSAKLQVQLVHSDAQHVNVVSSLSSVALDVTFKYLSSLTLVTFWEVGLGKLVG